MSMSRHELITDIIARHKELCSGDNSFVVKGEAAMVEQRDLIINELNRIVNVLKAHMVDKHNILCAPDSDIDKTLVARKLSFIKLLIHLTIEPVLFRHTERCHQLRWRETALDDYITMDSWYTQNLLANSNVSIRADAEKPFYFDVVFTVETDVVIKASSQPLTRIITNGMKATKCDGLLQHDVVMSAIKNIDSCMKSLGKTMYYYLCDRNYHEQLSMFNLMTSGTSCMTKPSDYWEELNAFPLDAYENSPDFKMMFISPESPDEIEQNLNQESVPYPFQVRMIVVPKSRTAYRGTKDVRPFVFGKAYGIERIVSLFYRGGEESIRTVYTHNENPLLTHVYAPLGARLPVVYDNSRRVLLPYIDQANCVIRCTRGKKEWLVCSDGVWIPPKSYVPQAMLRCQYNKGYAFITKFFDPIRQRMLTVTDMAYHRVPYMETPIGLIHREIYDKAWVVTSSNRILPRQMTVTYSGRLYALDEVMMVLVSGDPTLIPRNIVEASPDVYRRCGDLYYVEVNELLHLNEMLTSTLRTHQNEAVA